MLADLAMRDGQPVAAFDLFGDLDLRRGGARVVALPGGSLTALVDAAVQMPAGGVVYGASFENHPALVARLAERHALLGNAPQTLRAVRDPQRLASALRDAGLPYPRTFAAAPDDRSGRWLRKPLRGGGGTRVRAWRGGALPAGDGRAGAHRRGRVLGGGGRRRGGRGRARAHRAARRAPGVRRARLPLVREPRPAAPARRRARRPAGAGARDLLVPGRRVRACAGCSASTSSGTASARGRSRSTRARRRRSRRSRRRTASACSTRTCGRAPASCRGSRPSARGAAGKAVLFATEDVVVGDSARWLERGVRDVPHPGERIAAGHPICTVVAAAATPQDALARARGAGRAAARGARAARGGGGRWLTRRAPGAGAPATTSRRPSPTGG